MSAPVAEPRADAPGGAQADAGTGAGAGTGTGGNAAAPFRHAVRVYWEDTDAGGIVFYANYLKYFERARTEWLRGLGIGQQALRDATGAIFVVTSTAVDYRAPARLDDLVDVTVRVAACTRASMQLEQQAWRGGTLLAEGRIRIGCVDAATLRPRRFPPELAPATAGADRSPTAPRHAP